MPITRWIPPELRPVLKAGTAARIVRAWLARDENLPIVERDALETLCQHAEKEG